MDFARRQTQAVLWIVNRDMKDTYVSAYNCVFQLLVQRKQADVEASDGSVKNKEKE